MTEEKNGSLPTLTDFVTQVMAGRCPTCEKTAKVRVGELTEEQHAKLGPIAEERARLLALLDSLKSMAEYVRERIGELQDRLQAGLSEPVVEIARREMARGAMDPRDWAGVSIEDDGAIFALVCTDAECMAKRREALDGTLALDDQVRTSVETMSAAMRSKSN